MTCLPARRQMMTSAPRTTPWRQGGSTPSFWSRATARLRATASSRARACGHAPSTSSYPAQVANSPPTCRAALSPSTRFPGLRLALTTDSLLLALSVRLSTGETLETNLHLPQVISAIVLKAYAFAARSTERDLLDLWKLLETAWNAGITAADWHPVHAQKRDALRHLEQRVIPATSAAGTIARTRGWPHERIAALARQHVPARR